MAKRVNKRRLWWLIPLIAVVLLCGAFAAYAGDYSRADAEALRTVAEPPSGVTVQEVKNRYIAFVPQQPKAGLIFYPGGKVQYEAYAPLLAACAEQGVLCVLVHVPANLAILNTEAAAGVKEMFPEVSDWYLGGHSLGGIGASMHLAKHRTEYKGIVFLASYSTNDLNGMGIRALSVYGTNDGVLNMEKYAENRGNFPENTLELPIDGGCHAYFGNYGEQAGDGTPTISRETQQRLTVKAMLAFLLGAA